MKKLFLLLFLSIPLTPVHAKKVKFAVDMTGQVLSPNGIHVTGDFQTLAGYLGGDWQSNTTTLTQEGVTDIYSIVVEIPAFAKYEYKFVNGDQFYEAEFVPVESRVGYNFVDNRWLFVDSFAADTTFIGAILFAGNAPTGKNLTRFYVNMQGLTLDLTGVHVAGDFQGWDPTTNRLYSFGSDIYEIIEYVNPGTTFQYKFYNGNTSLASEIVPAGCAINANREMQITGDILLPVICFSSCTLCSATSITEITKDNAVIVFPNPTSEFAIVKLPNEVENYTVVICELTGRVIQSYSEAKGDLKIEKKELNEGAYLILVYSNRKKVSNSKLIIQ